MSTMSESTANLPRGDEKIEATNGGDIIKTKEESSGTNRKEDASADELAKEVSKLSIEGEKGAKEEEEEEAKKDEEISPQQKEFRKRIERIAEWIRSGRCNRILVLSGAGVSVSAGIPDFRTPGTGLYDNLQKYNLPFPEAVFDLDFYRLSSSPFVHLASELWPTGQVFRPTPTHYFIALLESKGLLLRNYTQNIDGLERLAGVSSERVLECHGHFQSSSCIDCHRSFPVTECRRLMVEERRAPLCDSCGGLVKPDIVFFGEGLPERFGRSLRGDLYSTNLLLVMGTSLAVAPVSLIPEMVSSECRRVLMNREPVGDFGSPQDVFLEGNCDDSIHALCKELGWEDELQALMERGERQAREGGGGRGNEDEEAND